MQRKGYISIQQKAYPQAVSVYQSGAEINLRVKRTGEIRRGGFSIDSVIIADVRRDDRGGLTLLVNRSPLLDLSGELALLRVLGQVSYLQYLHGGCSCWGMTALARLLPSSACLPRT